MDEPKGISDEEIENLWVQRWVPPAALGDAVQTFARALLDLAAERADAVKMLRLFVDADSLEDSEMYQEAMEKARAAIAAATEGGDAR